MPRQISFDPKCYHLAEHFLGDGLPEEAAALAREIQKLIEDWLEYELPKRLTPPPSKSPTRDGGC